MIHVVVFFLLLNGGSVQVDRYYKGHELNEEVCEVMATDVMNELLGPKRGPVPAIDMTGVKAVRFNCWWMV